MFDIEQLNQTETSEKSDVSTMGIIVSDLAE
jgi:hypothetical protein